MGQFGEYCVPCVLYAECLVKGKLLYARYKRLEGVYKYLEGVPGTTGEESTVNSPE